MFISYIWRLLIWKKITFLWTTRGGNRNETGVTFGRAELKEADFCPEHRASAAKHCFPLTARAPSTLPTALGACVTACSHSKCGICLCFYRSCDMSHLTRISGVCSRKEAQQRAVVCWSGQVKSSPTSRVMSGQGQGVHPPRLPFLPHFFPESKTPDQTHRLPAMFG